MKKILAMILVALVMISCGTSKRAPRNADYTAEEVELYGYGVGTSTNENTARGIAMTAALGDLSIKMQASVRAARSNYEKETGSYNKALYESLTDIVTENKIMGVTYKGDKKPAGYRRGKYTYRIEARVDQTIFKRNVDSILDQMDATAEERDAYRREMFGE